MAKKQTLKLPAQHVRHQDEHGRILPPLKRSFGWPFSTNNGLQMSKYENLFGSEMKTFAFGTKYRLCIN
jgi:hypothetical protein